MTEHVVFCFARNAEYVAGLNKEYRRLSNNHGVALQVCFVTSAEDIIASPHWQLGSPLRIVILLAESEPDDVSKILKEIAALNMEHTLILGSSGLREAYERARELMIQTPDPHRRIQKLTYTTGIKDRVRAIANGLCRSIAAGRI